MPLTRRIFGRPAAPPVRPVPPVIAALVAIGLAAIPAWGQAPGRRAGGGIVVGLEYALLDNERATAAKAGVFAETAMPGMKHLPEGVAWGKMQPSAGAAIDFSRLDWFVREYQRNGFTELTVALKPHSTWGSKQVGLLAARNASPKPRYLPLYARWVGAVVERYDADGSEDMPGLRWPVRYYEIGTELSSYEPEPIDEYLKTLEVAYEAAHDASHEAIVAHAAFLTTPVDLDVEDPRDYERAWRATRLHDRHHGLADQRAVLDRPELFDVLNLHNLGSPDEIEHQLRWLRWETARRGYSKPVIVSDTLPTPYIAWGPATVCSGSALGLLVPPATEKDRCRLAAFFTRLVEKDADTLAWTRGFVAADHVQRAVIAAEQGVALINLSFVSDLPWLTLPGARAGAGISAWGGAIRQNPLTGKVHERYPLLYAIRQLMDHVAGYRAIRRVATRDPQARVYRVERAAGDLWIAWRDPAGILLPEDGRPELRVTLAVGAAAVLVEPAVTEALGGEAGSSRPPARRVAARDGKVRIGLTHTPVYVLPAAAAAN